MPMSLWKRKGWEEKGGVESQKCDLLCSVHKPLKSRISFAQAVKTGVFALLLLTAKHLDQRQGLKSQPTSSPKWAFWYHTGWCQNLPKIRMQLWGGSTAKSTSSVFERCHTIAARAAHSCSNQKQDPLVPGSVQMSVTKPGQEARVPLLSQGVGGADAISTMKAEVQRPAKRRNNIEISTFPRSDKHLGAELLPCCVRRK